MMNGSGRTKASGNERRTPRLFFISEKEVRALALTVQAITLQATQGNTVYSDWIDVSAFKRVRLLVPEQEGGEYIFRIDQSTVDEAVTPPVYYGTAYAAGASFKDGFIPQSDVFDVEENLGANQIKIAYQNISTHEDPITIYLIQSDV